ncbi:succinate dehydrogenase cytochrome b556 subunit [Dongshaea marina]|uniref:succinate dehydrogenase cytochrome b556 subunit n=1 Tax=Dongshaea marina TaxID=2047966 RepID=UPI001900FA6E
MNKKQRPVNLELATIRFPITAIASILHRVSGVIIFVALAVLLWLLNLSLSSPEGFSHVASLVDNFFVKFILWAILTALGYHICAGVRHLVMDLGYCEEKESGKMSAKVSFIVAIVLAILSWGLVW